MKKICLKSLAGMLAVALIFTACNKDKEAVTPAEDTTAADDHNESQAESDNSIAMAEDAMRNKSEQMRTSRETSTTEDFHGATLTLTPKTATQDGSIVIDFGTGTTYNGRTHKGKMIITFNGKYFVPNTQQVLTFDNYYVNATKVEGRKTFTHAGDPAMGTYTTYITTADFKLTRDGKSITWSGTEERLWNNKGTVALADDTYTINGERTGTNRRGNAYTAFTTAPLLLTAACAIQSNKIFPVSGKIKITSQGRSLVVDYGTGTCDQSFTVTAN